jgi:heme-degrading monooxygenase HmoA
MFVLIARYTVTLANQEAFVQESIRTTHASLTSAAGCRRVVFLRNLLDPTDLSVLTEWDTKTHFLSYIRRHPAPVPLVTPNTIGPRLLYESLPADTLR